MRITRAVRIQNQLWRYDPATGFLRCTAVILQSGVMAYTREEIGAPADVAPGQTHVRLLVPIEALEESASISSLEGIPAVVGHVWQTAESADARCGSIAGAPYLSPPDLVGDILVTDRDAARRIMLDPSDAESLQEISSAFDALVNWGSGVLPDGQEYDGYFTQIRYNHVAILPAGQARGGSAVRIVNKEPAAMPEVTRMKLPSGKAVRVLNEDVPVLEEELKDTEEKVKNAIKPEQLGEAMARLDELTKQMEPLTKERDELLGQLQALKEQLEAATGAEAVEAAALQMSAERDEAAAVMNSRGKTLDAEQKKLVGHALRIAVVNSIRSKPLGDDEAKNEAFVRGVYMGLRDAVQAPTGASVVNTGQHQPAQPGPSMDDPAKRRERLGYPVAK